MISFLKDKKGFFGLISVLLALVIILYLTYVSLKTYFKAPSLDKNQQKTISEMGIDTSTHKAVLDSVKSQLSNFEKQQSEHLRELEDIK